MRAFFFALVLFFPLIGYAVPFGNDPDFGIIRGRVTTSDGKPAASVSVMIKGTKLATITEEDGSFLLHRIKPGIYELELTLIGYETQVQSVVVEKNQTAEVNIQIRLSNQQLQEVIVSHSKNRYDNKRTEQVARLPLRNLENPQVYNVVGSELMKEQLVTERTDIYRNVPGAVPNFAAGGSQGLTMRGFQNATGTRNGLVTSPVVPLNPAILERIEFIKGPAGTLFGNSRNVTFGGVYNYVTKKPYDRFGGEVSYTMGSYGFHRLSADVNAPINKKMAARFIAAGQTENTFQDQGFSKNFTIAPSFSWQVNERLSIVVDAEFTRGNYTTSTLAFGDLKKVNIRSLKDLPFSYKTSLIDNSVDINNGITNIQAQAEYKLSSQWKSQTNVLYSNGYYKDFYWPTLTLINDSMISRTARNQTPETFGVVEAQQNFIGDFRIGSLRNRLVVGLDLTYQFNELNRVTVPYDVVNLRSPIPVMSGEKLDSLSNKLGFGASTTKTYNYSAYVSNVLNITPTLMAMMSVRYDYFDTKGTFTPAKGTYDGGYNQSSFSPKLGVVYQPVKDMVSLFANYNNGFVNLGPVMQADKTTLKLKPQYGNQWEAGVKTELFRNKLSATVSLYQISITNSIRVERDKETNFNITIQDGTQRSRGLEAEVIANPVTGFNIIAGYAFNENEYTRASDAIQGKYVVASPKHVVNLWLSYTFTSGRFKGFGAGAGGNYVGNSWYESSNQVLLPAYTLLNASLFYDRPKYRVSFKANNLLDAKYWNSNGTAQKPFNILGSVAFKF